MRAIRKDGLVFEIYEDGRAAVIRNEGNETVTVPSEIEGAPVTIFCFDLGEIDVKKIILPASVETFAIISYFEHNIQIEIDEKNPYLYSDGKAVYTKDRGELIYFLAHEDEEYTVLPDCKAIGADAFHKAPKLRRVVLPKGLTDIGEMAFSRMSALKEIDLENVKHIGTMAFEHSVELEKVSLKCDSIGERAFCFCDGLTEAEVDCGIISNSAFQYCKNLQKVILKNTREIGNEAFSETERLTEIILPPELEDIGDSAFYRSGIKALTIPKTVRRIGREIADYNATEIHIYDNIETDIRRDHDISPAGYVLYVHSAETDEIKYAVPVLGYAADPEYGYSEHDRIVDMFAGGVNFDFKEYDRYFDRLTENYVSSTKFEASRLRLRYGYELDEDMRRKYEECIRRQGPYVIAYYIEYSEYNSKNIRGLFDPELYNYLSIEQILEIIDKSARNNLTEYTAFLLRICNEKNARPETPL